MTTGPDIPIPLPFTKEKTVAEKNKGTCLVTTLKHSFTLRKGNVPSFHFNLSSFIKYIIFAFILHVSQFNET